MVEVVCVWFRKEVGTALRTKALVLPVICGGRRPARDQLPEDLHDFLGLNDVKLTQESGWHTHGVAAIAAKLKRQLALDFRIIAVLRRLLKPLLEAPATAEAAFGGKETRHRLWHFFQAARGIQSEVELQAGVEVDTKNPEPALVLESLANFPAGGDGLLRFLLLVLHRKHKTKEGKDEPAFVLPPDLRAAWEKVINEAWSQGESGPWKIEGGRRRELLDWAKEGDLRPRFQLYFQSEPSQNGTYHQFRVTGRQFFGFDQKRLDVQEDIPYDESFSSSMAEEEVCHVFRKWMAPLFQNLLRQAAFWVGGDLTGPLIPELEAFSTPEQLGWPFETIICAENTSDRVGVRFRIARRLLTRHEPGTPNPTWVERSGEYQDNLAAEKLISVPSWDQLREAAENHGAPVGFVVSAAIESRWYHDIIEHHLVCGAWVQSADCRIQSGKLEESIASDAPTHDEIRKRRGSPQWKDVMVMLDQYVDRTWPNPDQENTLRKQRRSQYQ